MSAPIPSSNQAKTSGFSASFAPVTSGYANEGEGFLSRKETPPHCNGFCLEREQNPPFLLLALKHPATTYAKKPYARRRTGQSTLKDY
jgi:hypothetical protein